MSEHQRISLCVVVNGSCGPRGRPDYQKRLSPRRDADVTSSTCSATHLAILYHVDGLAS